MQKQTLLERIALLDEAKKAEVTKPETPQQILERSLARHLTAILNTSRGSVSIASDYGIADVATLGHNFNEESIEDFVTELETMLMRYEPRLSSIKVTYTPRPDLPLAAVFMLEAVINDGKGEHVIRFETLLDAMGKVRLS